MFTWILLAILIAALFGVINLDSVREWTVQKTREAWPHIQEFSHRVHEKMGSAKAKVENTTDKIGDKFDEAKEKTKDFAEEMKDKYNENKDNNDNY